MAMTSSMLPEEVSVNFVRDKYASGSSDYLQFLSLSTLESIVDLWGDNWTAEEVSSGANAIHWIDAGGYSRTLASGKSIPMLKNTTLYPNLGIFFPCQRYGYDPYYAGEVNVCVVNISTGESLSRQLLSDVNVNILYMDVHRFNANTKAIGGASDRGQEHSAIIFTENGIITVDNMGLNASDTYRVILADGTYADTIKREMIDGAARTHFEPVYCEASPSVVFDGVYIYTRGTNRVYRIVTYDGVTYDIFGNNRVGWSDLNIPIFVVSSEILA